MTDRPPLKPSLVEWKPVLDYGDRQGFTLLETFLVEWKPEYICNKKTEIEPLKPS